MRSKLFSTSVALLMAVSAITARAANTITFDNQSGKPALVKVVGPTSTSVFVGNGETETVEASAGHYLIKVRYGSPGKYSFSKGDDFDVTETATASSRTTITLHKVVNGNYGSRAISEKEFGVADETTSASRVKNFAETKAKALAGEAKAQCELGLAYANGDGVSEDQTEAAKWLRKAAEQGNATAQNNLAQMYHTGRGVAMDNDTALKWFRKAAEQGDVRAQFNLGLMLSKEAGVPRDYEEAAKWYRKAAEQGHAAAQHNLGIAYANGFGVSKDVEEAVKWFRKSAEQDYADGEYELGIAYMSGTAVTRNKAEAIKWFRKAAEQGNGDAQFNFAIACYNGDTVPKSAVEAYKWISLAADQGVARARSGLQTVAGDMSTEQISEAKRLASEFKPHTVHQQVEVKGKQ